MKKIYFLVTALLIGANINAQNVADFESFTLAPNSFDNGSGGGGDFILNNVVLSNIYDAAWGSWNGFSISNMTDTVTAGWANQYSCVVGSGANASSNYGVFYPNGNITNNNNGVFSSFKITNTTYAAISMRDGDSFAKKFGDSTDANGIPDGTNGEDFFKVWILVEDATATQKDSIEFFFADYRFADSTEDYIVNTWETIDLTNIPFGVAKIDFRLESSDNGSFGMNTPAYFAIDNVTFGYAGINEFTNVTIIVYPNPVVDELTVTGVEGTLTLTDMNGRTIFSTVHVSKTKIDMSDLESGIYLLRIENTSGSVTRRIIK